MKQIHIVGCSFTEGAELHDEHLIENYWDFKKIDPALYLRNLKPSPRDYYLRARRVRKIYKNNLRKYTEDCKQWAWPATFKKIIKKECNIIDHSLGGSGIAFFQYLYNLKDIKNLPITTEQYIFDRKDFKKNVLESDLLIWQLTNEPRYFITVKDEKSSLLAVEIAQMKIALEFPAAKIIKWKRKMLLDYYENVFDEYQFFKQKINFLHYILYQRILAKKHTILFSVYDTNFENIEFKKIDSKYVHYLNDVNDNKAGLVNKFIDKKLVNRVDTYCEFMHPTKKVHKLIADHINKYITRKGLL